VPRIGASERGVESRGLMLRDDIRR